MREKLRARDRQRKLDEDADKRAEVRRGKEKQEAERGERSRLNSLTIVQQTQETLRLQGVARATRHYKENAPQNKARIKAIGQSKRPADTHQGVGSGRLDGRQSRWGCLF